MSLTRYGYHCRCCGAAWDSEHPFGNPPSSETCHDCGYDAGRDWRSTAVFPRGVSDKPAKSDPASRRGVITNGPPA